MLKEKIQQIKNLLEDIDDKLKDKYDLEEEYPNCLISLKVAFEILDENLDVLENLNESEFETLVWYRIENFQFIDDINNRDVECLSTLYQKIDFLVQKIETSLNNIILNSVNYSFLVSFVNSVLQLNTIIKDFRLDLDVKKLAGVRKKYNDAKNLLDKASNIVENLKNKENEIKDLSEDLEKLIFQKDIIEKLYEKSEEINENLNLIDNKLDDFDYKKREIDDLYDIVEEIRIKVEKLKEDFQKKIGEYEASIRSFEEEKNKTLLEFQKEIQSKKNKLEEYEKKQHKKLNELIEKAQNTLEWTTASGLKTAFSQKANWLKWESIGYFILFLVSSFITLFISISVIFAPEVIFSFLPIKLPQNISISHIEDNNILLFLTRAGIIGTSIFFTWLMWKIYIKTKLLFEEYKKKEILAQNLMIGANTLMESLGFSKKEVIEEYIKPSIQKILEDSTEKVYGLYNDHIEKDNPLDLIKIKKLKKIKILNDSQEKEKDDSV